MLSFNIFYFLKLLEYQFKIDFKNTKRSKMISVCKDKFAFYDKESDAIVYKNSRGKRSLSLGGKVLTSLCVTDDRLHFIIDNLYVRGKLDEGVYRSVDNLRLEGKNWVKSFTLKGIMLKDLHFSPTIRRLIVTRFSFKMKKRIGWTSLPKKVI